LAGRRLRGEQRTAHGDEEEGGQAKTSAHVTLSLTPPRRCKTRWQSGVLRL
jgi:hypothetical protein